MPFEGSREWGWGGLSGTQVLTEHTITFTSLVRGSLVPPILLESLMPIFQRHEK